MSQPSVWDWLCGLRLEQYSEAFLSAGLSSPRECMNITAEQLESFGVTLPGHRRRILASLRKSQGHQHAATLADPDAGLGGGMADPEPEEAGQQENPVHLPLEKHAQAEPEKDYAKSSAVPSIKEENYPVLQERQVSRTNEYTGGGEMKQKPEPCGRGREGVDGQGERPVPKERTKFRVSATDSHAVPRISPACDVPLPPVPPRSTLNCPPQCFTAARDPDAKSSSSPTSPPPARLPVRSSGSDGRRRTAPVSPSRVRNAPPLPPKTGFPPKGPPPVPQRSSLQTPTPHSPPSTGSGTEEMQKEQAPQVPPRSSRSTQAQETRRASAHLEVLPSRRSSQTPQNPYLCFANDDSDDYEEPGATYTLIQPVKTPDREMSLQVPSMAKGRYSSLCSDDELLGDEDPAEWVDSGLSSLQSSVYLPSSGRRTSAPGEDTSHLHAVIKMGWLDKNPPQGALYYQRRWVKLDVDYLRYFDSEKEVYSKRTIATSSITNVNAVGELKFEVVTGGRTFAFRAENEAERNEWVAVLQDCTRGRHGRSTMSPGSPLMPDFKGYLELKGLRSKLYTVVASDKVFLYKNMEDYRIGVGITAIEMNVGNVKVTDRRSFDLTTPYRIFSFVAESEQLREQWVDAMLDSIGEALSNKEVADRLWAEPSNSFCADCGAPKPEWAAINLCVVVCKRCAGEHRGLGPSISKVRSLTMDRKVWTEELMQVFLLVGNERANSFWAANVPPSEALTPCSCSDDRRHFISNKYRQGKYRKYHPLYGNQKELDNALCINVQSSDVLETLSLIFCGADVNCSTGMAGCPSPISLANTHSQPLQAELMSLNLNTELPRLEVASDMETAHYSATPCVSHNGFLFKTGSMVRAVTEHKAREEFSRRWCTLNDGTFSYYESDRNANPNGALKATEIVCLAVDPPKKHGYEHTFEVYSESERLYLFGTDDPKGHGEWVKSLAKSITPAVAEPLLRLSFERIGRLRCKDGLNLQTSKVGWFALAGSTLHACLENGQEEEIHLRKLNELSIQQENEVLVLVERGRTLYIEGERKLDFSGWCGAIQGAARGGGDTLGQQQLTEMDIPVIVHSCIGYITQCGLMSEGIYRKSGVSSRVAALYDRFRSDARSVRLKEGEHMVDDVSSTLKRFFRELEEGLFTTEDASTWLSTAAIQDESKKISQYQTLLNRLPRFNKATLQALINHLYCVQRFSAMNQMNLHNLAIVFGPTLFQMDGKDYTAGRAVEDLIQHYTCIFKVDEQQLKKQLEEITLIIEMREKLNTKFPSTEPGGHFIYSVYLEQMENAEQLVKIPASMTAAELTCDVLDRRNIPVTGKDYWSCWEVNSKEEMERPLHYQERVLSILPSFGTDSRLLIKKHLTMEAMLIYLSSKVDPSKHGRMKFREGRSILGVGLPSASFHDRYFILNSSSLRMYKDVRSNNWEHEWPVKNLKIYLGIKKKFQPPTCWGLTLVYESKKQEKTERQHWLYVCCDSHPEMREWYATFLSIQYDGNVWPEGGLQPSRVKRVLPSMRHGNVSLIPLRGSENEMRNSVAAFSQDPLSLYRDVQ